MGNGSEISLNQLGLLLCLGPEEKLAAVDVKLLCNEGYFSTFI
jgi:hypothetical protein